MKPLIIEVKPYQRADMSIYNFSTSQLCIKASNSFQNELDNCGKLLTKVQVTVTGIHMVVAKGLNDKKLKPVF